jgi:hypothetical protein
MKKSLLFLLIGFLSIAACKKAIEEKKQDLIVQAMTNGRWLVQEFRENNVDVSANFQGYEFQFYDNGKVDGITGTATTSGTWVGNISNLTISASFPAGNVTLVKLNAVWNVVDNSFDYVKAQTTVNGVSKYMYLKKK